MGIFDFFKTKDKPTDTIIQPKVERSECDITKTQVMVDLFLVPQEQRDDEWMLRFYSNVQTASYACGNPQVFTGPDGFPYFSLKTPVANQPFESFCIRNMKDDFLLDKGFGIAINPTENTADWVFSYGDIVNLHINKEFFTTINNVKIESEETIKKEEKVLVAQPSESYLPKQARQALKLFLQHVGVKKPKIMMICRTIQGQMIRELAFNVYREDFNSAEELNYRLQQISWFLPKHYIVLSVPKNSNMANDFVDL